MSIESTFKGRSPLQRGKAWRPFSFKGLPRLSRADARLRDRMDFLVPSLNGEGAASEALQARLSELFDEQVKLEVEDLRILTATSLRSAIPSPCCLAVLALTPQTPRSFLDIDLSLAHAAIDLMLGGAGEVPLLRSLTDIEDGVMSYLVLEMLKAISTQVAEGLPKLRLEGLARSADDLGQLLPDTGRFAAVSVSIRLLSHRGYLRLYVPEAALGLVAEKAHGQDAARIAELAVNHASRLSAVEVELRAEIGMAAISAEDLVAVKPGDVVLLEQLTVRADLDEGGTAKLKVGRGLKGYFSAEVFVDDGQFLAKITSLEGPEPKGSTVSETESEAGEGDGEEVEEIEEGDAVGSALLGDVPLEVVVELGRVPISAEDVVSLKVGQVLDLNRSPGDAVELSVNGKVVARGELVEVEGTLGVRILSIN